MIVFVMENLCAWDGFWPIYVGILENLGGGGCAGCDILVLVWLAGCFRWPVSFLIGWDGVGVLGVGVWDGG